MVSPCSNEEEIPKRLDKETINQFPLIRFHGSVKVAENSKAFQRYAAKLRNQRVLGSKLDIDPIRNKILLKVLPLKV